MKFPSIMLSKYWTILPWIFFVSLVLFLTLFIPSGGFDSIGTNHADVHVADVQPSCVAVTTLDQNSNRFEVNIDCYNLLQNPNRKPTEEEIAYELNHEVYELGANVGAAWRIDGKNIFRTFIPRVSADWKIEKRLDNISIILSGEVKADVVYIGTAFLYRTTILSLFGLLIMSFLYLPKVIRNYFKKT